MNYIENQTSPSCDVAEPTEGTRRRFLKMAAASGIAMPMCSSMALAGGGRRKAPPRQRYRLWEIEAVRVEQIFSEGSVVPYFRYRALGSTTVSGSVPVLTGNPGQVVELRVANTLGRDIQPMIVGGTPGPVIAAGADVTFRLVVPPEGTWLLTDYLLGDAAGPMGLGAVIVSRAAKVSRKFVSGYDREYVLLYVDSDDRWNGAIDSGQVPNYAVYEPNFHTVNNLTFPATASDAGTRIECRVGERVLLRLCNLGWMRQAIHFHGYHVDIERINNQPQSIYGPKDTVPLSGHSTVEVVLTVNQPGIFPVHPHSLTTTTDNGVYIAGQVTLIVAT